MSIIPRVREQQYRPFENFYNSLFSARSFGPLQYNVALRISIVRCHAPAVVKSRISFIFLTPLFQLSNVNQKKRIVE